MLAVYWLDRDRARAVSRQAETSPKILLKMFPVPIVPNIFENSIRMGDAVPQLLKTVKLGPKRILVELHIHDLLEILPASPKSVIGANVGEGEAGIRVLRLEVARGLELSFNDCPKE